MNTKEDPTATGKGTQELHKPPVWLFLLPLVLIVAYGYFTR